jgi:hypothetical protein
VCSSDLSYKVFNKEYKYNKVENNKKLKKKAEAKGQ